MANGDAFALRQSNLNQFLLADIGVEDNGLPLSVVSALARLDLDPWLEAGRLAGLPRPIATRELARVIAMFPAGLWQMPDATSIAVRLVALLPGQHAIPVASAKPVARERGTLLVAAALALAFLAAIAAHVSTVAAPSLPVAALRASAPADTVQAPPARS